MLKNEKKSLKLFRFGREAYISAWDSMTDPGSQRSKRMPQNCPAEIADEKPSRRQFVDLKLIDHGHSVDNNGNKRRNKNI